MGKYYKCIFFWNPGIVKLLAVEMDVKPQNVNFANVEKKGGGGGVINREGAFVWIDTVPLNNAPSFEIHLAYQIYLAVTKFTFLNLSPHAGFTKEF